MTNTDFWKSISTIITNGFDKDGIIKLEDYAEQFFNKQLLFKRYTPSEQHGCATGGSFHVVASILAGAETPTNQLTAPEGSFKRDCQRAEAQAAVIEQWAKTTGCWVDGVDKAFEQTTDDEIRNYVESLGFKLINPRNWTYATPGIYLSDMHDENLIKSPQGNIFVIDCDIRINTPNLKCEGVRERSNEVEFTV